MIYILLGIMVVLVAMLGYAVFNLLRKVELYETMIERFYTNTINILRTVRELDDRQMFEKDDEVGTLFQQLIGTIGELRGVVYEEVYDNTQESSQGFKTSQEYQS